MTSKEEIKTNKSINGFSFLSGAEIEEMEISPVEFVVEDFLPVGLTILASPPKMGKSWLSLDLATSVSSGTPFLGYKTNQSEVLYLDLEDSINRAKVRMQKVLNGQAASKDLFISTTANRIDEGLVDALNKFLEAYPNTKLVIIDTFAKIRGASKRGESIYQYDSREAGDLKKFADSHGVALLLVTHTSKTERNDSVANVNTTNGLTGIADSIFILSKSERMSNNAELMMTGRDIEANELKLTFNQELCKWFNQGTVFESGKNFDEEIYNNSPLVKAIKCLISENGGKWRGRANEIIKCSIETKHPIKDSAQAIGRKLPALSEDLYRYDRITYTPIQNGKGSKMHEFSIV